MKRRPEVRVSTFVKAGHRTHTNWARHVRKPRVQALLEEEEARWNEKYAGIPRPKPIRYRFEDEK